MSPKSGEIKESKDTIRSGNALIEISHGLSANDLAAIPLLRMANMVTEVKNISEQINQLIKQGSSLTITDILDDQGDLITGARKRVSIMVDGELVGLVGGTREQLEDLQAQLDFYNEQKREVPLGFVGNPFVVETLTILKNVLINNEVEQKVVPPPWLSSLFVCQSVRRDALPNGVVVTDLQIPRIVKNGERCQSSFSQSADSGADFFAIDKETGESAVVNISTDGVTVPGIENADIIARNAALEVYVLEDVQQAFANVNSVESILEAVDTFNSAFTEKVSQSKKDPLLDNPHATGAFAVTMFLNDGRKRVVSAVVGDARSTAIWIDKAGEIHVRTLTSPINKDFDRISEGYGRAAHKGFEKAKQILNEWYKNSYMDKYNGGEGTVAVLGEENLFDHNKSYAEQRNVNVAVDSFEIPPDVQYFKIFTSTDGLDLYAKLLDVPVWLADYVLSWNMPHISQSALKFSLAPENMAETLFYTPMGIAGMQGAYMIHNPDVFPPDIEPRPKIDDLHTSSSVFGSDQHMGEYLLSKVPSVQATSASFKKELQKLSGVWHDLFDYYKLEYEPKLFKNGRKRHKSKKR